MLAAYLPGADSFNETGLQLSEQFALPGDIALTASADWLQGDSFRIPRSAGAALNDPLTLAGTGGDGDRALEPRPAGLGRLSAFVPIGDRSGLELGSSYTQGTNNVAAAHAHGACWAATRSSSTGRRANAYLLVQAEVLSLARDDAGWNGTAAAYTKTHGRRPRAATRFSTGTSTRATTRGSRSNATRSRAGNAARATAVGAFAGLALMEETTSFRIGWERFQPPATQRAGIAPSAAAVNTVTIRVLYSMGPHKAHQF